MTHGQNLPPTPTLLPVQNSHPKYSLFYVNCNPESTNMTVADNKIGETQHIGYNEYNDVMPGSDFDTSIFLSNEYDEYSSAPAHSVAYVEKNYLPEPSNQYLQKDKDTVQIVANKQHLFTFGQQPVETVSTGETGVTERSDECKTLYDSLSLVSSIQKTMVEQQKQLAGYLAQMEIRNREYEKKKEILENWARQISFNSNQLLEVTKERDHYRILMKKLDDERKSFEGLTAEYYANVEKIQKDFHSLSQERQRVSENRRILAAEVKDYKKERDISNAEISEYKFTIMCGEKKYISNIHGDLFNSQFKENVILHYTKIFGILYKIIKNFQRTHTWTSVQDNIMIKVDFHLRIDARVLYMFLQAYNSKDLSMEHKVIELFIQ